MLGVFTIVYTRILYTDLIWHLLIFLHIQLQTIIIFYPVCYIVSCEWLDIDHVNHIIMCTPIKDQLAARTADVWTTIIV